MNTKLNWIAAVAGLLVAAVPAAAHHAFAAEFDSTKPVKLQGTVVKVEMVNPHSGFTLTSRIRTEPPRNGWWKEA